MSEALWAVGRASGVVLLVLMTATLLLGVLTRSGRRVLLPRFGVALLHRNVALLSVVFLAVHVLTMVLDSSAKLSLIDLVVPFRTAANPFWYGLGTVALDLAVAVTVTALLRHRIGVRAFKAVHWTAYLLWPMALLHALGSGSDAKAVLITGGLCGLAVAAAVVWRISDRFVEHRSARQAALR
ncbi:ferric reductase-like transmembrane domain-containing protein [Amnibacterium endophyticum]|uniref:Ferric reductase-like transmembrane domain-containing protein n=1 Tax=Amnibacterium endophyticum TaxID=2109337 RepID=A0ABW4LIR1_9MICO